MGCGPCGDPPSNAAVGFARRAGRDGGRNHVRHIPGRPIRVSQLRRGAGLPLLDHPPAFFKLQLVTVHEIRDSQSGATRSSLARRYQAGLPLVSKKGQHGSLAGPLASAIHMQHKYFPACPQGCARRAVTLDDPFKRC